MGHGSLKYTHELDAALALADFTKPGRLVLVEVVAQIHGPAKLKVARLSPSEIGHRAGMPRAHVFRGIKELINSNVLVKTTDGSYEFNETYELWTKNDRPRLSEIEQVYCKDAARNALSYKYRPSRETTMSQESPISGQLKPSSQLGRIAITPELRWEVFSRDDFRCQNPGCGSRIDLVCDHKYPESRGGPTTRENLQTYCRPCNSRKGNRVVGPIEI